MENSQIKEKLADYSTKFQIETNSFQKMVILHEYIGFIKSNKVFSDLLKNENKNTQEFAKECSKKTINIDNFKSLFREIGFVEEGKNIKDYSTNILTLAKPVFRTLSIMAFSMEEYKQADNKRREKLESNLKEAFSNPLNIIVVSIQFSILNTKLFEFLDKEAFLNKDVMTDKIIFDNQKSILYIKDKQIRIKRKKEINPFDLLLFYLGWFNLFFVKKKNVFIIFLISLLKE